MTKTKVRKRSIYSSTCLFLVVWTILITPYGLVYLLDSKKVVLNPLNSGSTCYYTNSNNNTNIDDLLMKTELVEARNQIIADPTGQTEGYSIESLKENFPELLASRGQTYRHFYNTTAETFTYQSDLLAYKEGIIPETPWITGNEYIITFILQLVDGQQFSFETANEINSVLKNIEFSKIWVIGCESFDGILGFYFNEQDTQFGHGQYVYWPRKHNGTLSDYNNPLYSIYPQIHLENNSRDQYQILTSRMLYGDSFSNKIKLFSCYNTSTEFGFSYDVLGVNINETTWNFRHGFKYRITDQSFHLITDLQCLDSEYSDVGLSYLLTTSPQNEDPLFQEKSFFLSNDQEEVQLTANSTWNAFSYLEDYNSVVQIFSESKTGFKFSFDDMEETGFTKKTLDFSYQELPDGTIRKVLRAGMDGFGSYNEGNWIYIDPTIDTVYSTDNYDLYKRSGSSYTTETVMKVGVSGGYPLSYAASSFLAFDTGVNCEIISIQSPVLQLYWTTGDSLESDEGISLTVYNIVGSGDGADSNTCKEDSLSYTLGTYSSQSKVWSHYTSAGYKTGYTAKVDSLLEDWAANRGYSENWISFMLEGYGIDAFEQDLAYIRDSQYSGSSCDPKLSFSYTIDNKNIGVFIYANALIPTSIIDDYQDIMESIGYTHFLTFCNEDNISDMMETIDNFESSPDTLFIYIAAHGEYNDEDDVSEVDIDNYPYTDPFTSEDLSNYLDNFEAQHKAVLVDSCNSGKFPDHLNRSPYLAMSSAHESAWMYSYLGWNWATEPAFSHHFWEAVNNGSNAIEAYYLAEEVVNDDSLFYIPFPQCPQITDNTGSFEFFEDEG